MSKTLEEKAASRQKEYDYRKDMRRLAKEGDPEAKAKVAAWDAAREVSKAKALARGQNYNAEQKRRLRIEAQENKAKGATGDVVAQAAYDKYRQQRGDERMRRCRRLGVKPLAEHLALVTLPPGARQAKDKQRSKAYYEQNKARINAARKAEREDLAMRAAAGDAEAIRKQAHFRTKQKEYWAKYERKAA